MKLSPAYNRRTYGLDVYRAIAIILVVLTHGNYLLRGTRLDGFPWVRLTDGVELFFVLSGFLIGTILIKFIHGNNYKINTKDILVFWKRRWFRTLPNYYLILLINVIFVRFAIIDGDIEQFNFKFILFLQNFSQPFYDFFWESWSLSIEEWFYIFLPIGLFLILKLIPSRSGILVVILILILLPLLNRVLHSAENVDAFWWDVKFRKVVLMRLDTIIYGVLAAWVKFYYNSFWKKYALTFFIAGLVMTLVMPYIPREPNAFFAKTFYFNLITIGAMLLLPYADLVQSFKSNFGKIITHISLISYSMYLINLALVIQVIEKNFPVVNTIDAVVKYVIYWLIVLLVSSLMYYYFERPMMNLRDKKLSLHQLFTRKNRG
ncbi:MAG: acyltransferase [Bacteroidota bacterium]